MDSTDSNGNKPQSYCGFLGYPWYSSGVYSITQKLSFYVWFMAKFTKLFIIYIFLSYVLYFYMWVLNKYEMWTSIIHSELRYKLPRHWISQKNTPILVYAPRQQNIFMPMALCKKSELPLMLCTDKGSTVQTH